MDFSTRAPISLYGSTKLAAEALALEYGDAFDFPVWINRCGVLAGAGQFGTPDQGVFSYWIHAHARRRPLRFIGFDGTGKQTRDVFHPRDLTVLADAQMNCSALGRPAHLLRRRRPVERDFAGAVDRLVRSTLRAVTRPRADTRPRPYDIPWVVMDSRDAERDFGWRVEFPLAGVLEEIAQHAESHPDWLETSAP